MKFEEMKVIEKSIVPIYEKNCIDGSNFHEQVVNARELWKALGSKQDFTTWAKKRLQEVDAEENPDYCLLHKKMEQLSGAKYLTEYIVTMDTAKEMAMLDKYTSFGGGPKDEIEEDGLSRSLRELGEGLESDE